MHLRPATSSLAKFHRPFCAMNPLISNSFHNLLYSFLVIFFFVLQFSNSLLSWQGSCCLQEPAYVSTILPQPFVPTGLQQFLNLGPSVTHEKCSLPVHSSYHVVSSHTLLSPFTQIFCQVFRPCTCSLAFSCTCCFFHISCIGSCWPRHTTLLHALFPLFSCPQRSTFLLAAA